jgi:hypothetical protein
MKKTLTNRALFTEYESFLFLEGQTGLPDHVDELYDFLHSQKLEVWVIEDIFKKPERIRAIPFLNPSVIIFQTTWMNTDAIADIIKYLEANQYKPKEIWECLSSKRTNLDTEKYNVYDFYLEDGVIELEKIK